MKKMKLFGAILVTAMLSAGMAMTAMAGWSQKDGRWYYYNDSSGQMVRDNWVQVDGKWYYMDYNGVMKANSMVNDTYYVNGSGVMVANTWVLLRDGWDNESGWRYFGDNGKVYNNGWKQIGDSWYHFTDGWMDSGWFDLDGKTYYLGNSGAMTVGWRRLPDEHDEWGECWYYFNSSGKRISGGEQTISGEVYVFDDYGRMLNGWVNMSDYTSSGRDDLSTSDIDSLKYFRSGGQRGSGWVYLASPDEAEENWYYLKDGRAYSAKYKTTATGSRYGLAKIKGETYCFDRRGRMVTGLVEIEDGRKFYFDDDNGKMRTGRVVVNDDEHYNEVFYFTTTGSIGNKGGAFTGVKDGTLYEDGNLVAAEDGMRYEKVRVDGKEYVVNEQGRVKTSGTVTDADGVKYKISKNSDGTYKIETIY